MLIIFQASNPFKDRNENVYTDGSESASFTATRRLGSLLSSELHTE